MLFDIPFYPGYKLTEDFQVIGKKGFPLTFSKAPYEFCNVFVEKSTILYRHRAIALVHVPGYFHGAHVDHIDNNPFNNDPSNLQWLTPRANNRKSLALREPDRIDRRIAVLKNQIALLEMQKSLR